MRRFILFILFAFSLFFVITGCAISNPKVERLVPPENAPEEVIFAPLSDSGVQSSSLIVGADTVIGRIEYWVDDEEKLLYIDFYATENGWLLTETRVATALSLAELPRNPETRRLDPDYYPNFNIHNPPVGISHFVLPLGELEPGTTTKLYFSAYAEAVRNENKYFSQIGITAPCVYYVITYTEPVIELRPILNVEVDGKIALSRVTEYDWELTKEATPEAIVDLERGDSATVEYTLTATRSVPEIKDTYTASGVATVTNYGSLEATKVGLKVTLLGKKGTDWLEIDSKVLIEVSSNTTIAASDLVGIGKPFTFTFDAGDYTEVKILAQAEDDWPESVSDEENHMVPVSPTGETKIDESASVIDMPVNLADFESQGFLVDHTGTWPWDESPWILDDVSGGKKIYSISIKNESADENSFGVTLTNTATLTESDTLEKREDNARVLVTTPEPFIENPGLDMTLEATVSWTEALEYDWTIEKSATPTSLTLAQGSSGTVNYTVAVTRMSGDATYTYTISGTATVLNTGNIALNVAGDVNLDGYAGKTVSIGPLIIAEGASHEVPFTFTVESATEIANFTVKGNAHSVDLPVNVDKSLGLVSPGTPESYTEIDEMADVIDKITGLPSGFKATASVEPREWKDLTDDATFTYIVTVTNEEATSGGKLTNTATVTENDTDEEDSDDEEVTVNVPGLNMTLEATVSWAKEIEYDWDIVKDATPTSLTLAQGSSGTVAYTVVVTRESEDATYTYTVSGKVIVQNTGTVGLTGVNGTVYLDGHAGKSLTLGPVSLNTGESKEFPYSFTVESDTEIAGFTVKAEIDSAETSDVSDSKNLTPTVDPQSLIEIDEMADVIDEITGKPSGFDISASVEPRVWNGLTDSATFTYTVTVTNQEATSGGKLTNTATVTENDTDEEDSDDEEVVLNVLGLNMELRAAVNWLEEIEYDWSIVKDATPTSLTLTQGSSGTVAYTVVVTRESEDATYTYTISGKVIVQNTGTVGLTNVEGTVYLDGYAGKSLALGPVSLAAAESKEFPYSFTVESKSKISGFTVKAEIDSAETSGIDDSENLTPTVDPQSLIEIDEMADVIDKITGLPSGFKATASVEPREWKDLTDDATFTYIVTVTNEEATSGGKLTNTATVTENDTDEKDSDDEEVTISVPGLDMTLEATVSWSKEIEYDWDIVKDATPTSLSLPEGTSGNINYTLEITRESGQATYTYTISGTVTVQNTGDVPLTDVYTKVTLVGYSMENTVLLMSPLVPGGSADTSFSFKIRSNTEISGFTVKAEADSIETPTSYDTAGLITPVDYKSLIEIDKTAVVNDLITKVPSGFTIIPPTIERNWDLADPDTLKYSLVLKNKDAGPGTYYLTNTATVTEDDTGEKHSDNATVTITVDEDPDLAIINEHDMEWDQERVYYWSIEKNADPNELELEAEEDGTFTYTLVATRTYEETNTSTITGIATVTNTGNIVLSNIDVEIILEDSLGVQIDKHTDNIATLAIGAQKAIPYSFNFDPTSYSAPFKVTAKATAGTASDEIETDQLLPTPKVTEIDKDAYVKDTFDPFDFEGIDLEGNDYREWFNIIEGSDWNSQTNSWSVSYTVAATNNGAEPGSYPLDNTVVIYGEDTDLEHDRDDAQVKIYVPVIGLEIELASEVSWTKETEYDWEIEKSATPTSVVLDKEESADIDYTVVVSKNKVSETYTYTVSGTVTVKNTGETTLNNISGKVYLDGYAGKEEPFGWASIIAGGSQTKTFSFEVTSSTPIASFKVEASADSDETASVEDDEELTPSQDPESLTEIDESADVIDEITQSPQGFEVTASKEPREWSLDNSDILSYTLTITNESAEPGTYYLTNTATVTENDTREESSDDATVTIEVPGLELELTAEMSWAKEQEYDWSIEKEADPTSLILDREESGEVSYTLTVRRESGQATYTYTIEGKVTLKNTGNTTLHNVAGTVELYADGSLVRDYDFGPYTIDGLDSEESSFSFEVVSDTPIAGFKVEASADSDETASVEDDEELTPSQDPESLTEIDESADVIDEITQSPQGFEVTASKEPREWSLDNSDTLSYTLTITNESAEPGTYYLTNTATVTEKDTKEWDQAEEEVVIEVPETVKLKAEVDAEFTWNRERIYEWEIDKKANPTSVTFDVDEFEKTIEYTITATKTLASEINTHTYSGNAVVTNNGNSQAENAKLLITLQYFDGTDWIDLQSETEVILGSIPSGASASYSFGPISFTPVQNIVEYRVKAVATADAPANSDEAYDSSTLTVTGSTETNASVVLNDSFTDIPEGFAIVETDSDPLPFPQNITENTTVVFEITLAKFFYSGSSTISYEMNKLGAYLKAKVTGYMAGEYPGWCTEVGVSGIGTSAVIESIYINGAPDAKYAKINYILNRYRDGLYSTSVDYRHIQIAIWAIMEGYLDWSWRSVSGINPEVPYGDKALVENIIATADEDFLPGCGDVILVRAKNASKQDLILEMEFTCGEEYELKNRATLKSETQDLWDDAIVTITLTPTDPEIFDIDLTAEYSMEKNTTYRWEIDKNVTPTEVELEKTKSTTFVYTLEADRYFVSASRNVQGSVVVSNTGTSDLLNVSVKITFKGDGTVLNTYETTIPLLSTGGSEVVPYSFNFSTDKDSYTIETRVVEMASGVSDFDSTVLVPTEVKHNETADVRDEFTNLSTFTGSGFTISPSNNPRIWTDIIRNVLWTAVDSNTWRTSFNIAVTNNTAAPGTYVLNNEVEIYDEDQLFDEDSASITITVRGGTWSEDTAWGGNYEGGGSSWWYYFDNDGPSVQAIYAGQKLIQGASVKYEGGKLIITLGPNMRLQNVNDSVKVQGYSSIPSSRPAPGDFAYKGTSLVISVSYRRYFAIHLDVEVWNPSSN